MFHTTHDQTNIWSWDNPCAFGDQVIHSNPQTTSSGKVKSTGERFSWYVGDDPRVRIDRPSCRQYKHGDFLPVRPLNWDGIIDKDDDNENRGDPRAPSRGRSHCGDDNDNDDYEGAEDMQGGETRTRKGNGIIDGNGKGKGNGQRNSKGKGIVNPYGEDSDTKG